VVSRKTWAIAAMMAVLLVPLVFGLLLHHVYWLANSIGFMSLAAVTVLNVWDSHLRRKQPARQ
jgi:hypothetical protein